MYFYFAEDQILNFYQFNQHVPLGKEVLRSVLGYLKRKRNKLYCVNIMNKVPFVFPLAQLCIGNYVFPGPGLFIVSVLVGQGGAFFTLSGQRALYCHFIRPFSQFLM